MMDIDDSKSVDIDEICIVHDSDREQMLKILDADGDKQVTSFSPVYVLIPLAAGNPGPRALTAGWRGIAECDPNGVTWSGHTAGGPGRLERTCVESG